jgi:uncharacterized protein
LTKFKSPVANVNIVLSNLQSTVKIVESTGEKPKVCRDPDDDNILWLAQSANANFIVTGDKDLLVLESFGTCQIVSVADFINQIMPTI